MFVRKVINNITKFGSILTIILLIFKMKLFIIEILSFSKLDISVYKVKNCLTSF